MVLELGCVNSDTALRDRRSLYAMFECAMGFPRLLRILPLRQATMERMQALFERGQLTLRVAHGRAGEMLMTP